MIRRLLAPARSLMTHPTVAMELEVLDLSHDARGVARLDGKTVFVAGALPGERVRAQLTRRHARYDEARTLELLRSSASRIAPPCPYYGRCGGCNLQHLDPAAQLEAHRDQLEQALQRLARLQPRRWLQPVASAPWGYRARARLAIERDATSGAIHIGLREERSHRIEPLAACAVLEPGLARLLSPLAATLAGLEAPTLPREAWLAAGDNGHAVALGCTAPLPPADRARLAEFAESEQFLLRLGVLGGSSECHWEDTAPALSYTPAEGLRHAFDPWHFTQANPAVNRALVASVLRELEPQPADRVLELYCGLGNFSLPLARAVARLTGIDGDAALLERARLNARANGCDNVEFVLADLAVAPREAPWARQRWDLVLLDPPRSGAPALAETLAKSGARRIAYVSCDAATLARDAARLATLGLRLEAAGVFEMFPQTSHFESLALFQR
jgi:23S rRNA (uracil1939-C5)-methyltransferase